MSKLLKKKGTYDECQEDYQLNSIKQSFEMGDFMSKLLKIEKKNILDYEVDAIVNAANKKLRPGGGVCGQIFAKANDKELVKECEKLGPIKPGQAVVTKGYNLKAKNIIHAVGPIYVGGIRNEKEILTETYKSALELALRSGFKTIVFPLISTGHYHYPVKKAAEVAVYTIRDFIKDNELDVTIAVLDDKIFKVVKEKDEEWMSIHAR